MGNLHDFLRLIFFRLKYRLSCGMACSYFYNLNHEILNF